MHPLIGVIATLITIFCINFIFLQTYLKFSRQKMQTAKLTIKTGLQWTRKPCDWNLQWWAFKDLFILLVVVILKGFVIILVEVIKYC